MDIIKTNLKWNGKLTKRRKTRYIILHCTAENNDATIEEIHNYHQKSKRWIGVGYNFLIRKDGSIYEGRPEECIGAHATNWNSFSIGIAYTGGVKSDGKTPSDTRTIEQKEAMYNLCYYLMGKYHIDLEHILGHYQITVPKPNMKACPSFKIEDFRQEYLDYISKKFYR